MQDTEILDLYFARDERALIETQKQYGAYVTAISSRIVGMEDAEEIVQDTYLAAWNSIPPQRPEHFRLYLARIARNLSFNRYKKERAQKRGGYEIDASLDELSEILPSSSPIDAEIEKKELIRCLGRFALELPERERYLFIQRYFYVRSVNELAEELGLKPNHAAVLLKRVRAKLKDYLEKEGYPL